MIHAAWLVPLGLVVLTAILWLQRWAASLFAAPISNPPTGFSPVEAGILVDGRFGTDGRVASVVHLAVRGIVGLQRMANDDVLVSVRRAWQRESGLRACDVALLAGIGAHGDGVRPLSEYRGGATDLDDVFDTLAETLSERGLLPAPPSALRRVGRWTTAIVTVTWAQLAWSFGASRASYAAALTTGVVLWGLASWLPRHWLTASGRRARRQLIGLRRFLTHAEQESLDQMPPDTLEKLLPWAIALRVSDAWISRFAGRAVAPNEWYTAATPIGVAELGREIERLHALLRPHGLRGHESRATVESARHSRTKRTDR